MRHSFIDKVAIGEGFHLAVNTNDRAFDAQFIPVVKADLHGFLFFLDVRYRLRQCFVVGTARKCCIENREK